MDCGASRSANGPTGFARLHNQIPDWNDLVYQGRLGDGGARSAFHQQLPGIHRSHLPRPLRGSLHAQSRERAGRHQDDRAGHRRQGLGYGLDQARAAHPPHRQARRGDRLRPRRPRRRTAASPGSATRCMSSNARRSPAGLPCATAFRISRWRSNHIDRRVKQMEAEGVIFHWRTSISACRRASRACTTNSTQLLMAGGAENPLTRNCRGLGVPRRCITPCPISPSRNKRSERRAG